MDSRYVGASFEGAAGAVWANAAALTKTPASQRVEIVTVRPKARDNRKGVKGVLVPQEFSAVHMGDARALCIVCPYRADIELRRLSQRPAEWVPMSRELFTVVRRAVEIAEASRG